MKRLDEGDADSDADDAWELEADRPAARHRQEMAGEIVRPAAAQEQRGIGDVLRPPERRFSSVRAR